MTRLGALEELKAKVEAGKAVNFDPLFEFAFYPVREDMREVYHANDANQGSLDAAMALHNAVLPGWCWHTGTYADEHKAIVFKSEDPRCGLMFTELTKERASRAWLIAILSALIAQERTNG